MKRLLFFLLLLAGSVWIGLQFKHDPGYLLIAYHGWTIEIPLWFSIISVLLTFWLFHLILSLLTGANLLQKRFRIWSERRRLHRSQLLTRRGLIQLAEGQWQAAEKSLVKAAASNDNPLINYLAAACAAQEQSTYDKRDDYLRMAHQVTPKADLAIGMVQAQLQLSHRQFEQSLATLKRLKELAPRHNYVLKLLQKLYLELQDWESWVALLPELLKRHVIHREEAEKIGKKAFQMLLIKAADSADVDMLYTVWRKTPKFLQQNTSLLKTYTQCLIHVGKGKEAIDQVSDALNKKWDDELVRLYGLIEASDPRKQLATAENWLKAQKDSPVLLLTLGRLAQRNQLWGKARYYFETSLGLLPQPETYRELAQLLDKMGNQALAEDYYRQGLKKATLQAFVS